MFTMRELLNEIKEEKEWFRIRMMPSVITKTETKEVTSATLLSPPRPPMLWKRGGALRKRMVGRSLEERKRQFPHLVCRRLFFPLVGTPPADQFPEQKHEKRADAPHCIESCPARIPPSRRSEVHLHQHAVILYHLRRFVFRLVLYSRILPLIFFSSRVAAIESTASCNEITFQNTFR